MPSVEVSPPASPDPPILSPVPGCSPPSASSCDHDSRPDLSVSVSLLSPVSAPVSSGVTIPNVYPMQTQYKSDIVKPKCILSLSTSLTEVEPNYFQISFLTC